MHFNWATPPPSGMCRPSAPISRSKRSSRHHRTERTHVTQLRCSWIPEEQKGLDQEEVKESLSRFVKSAPKGIMKAVQSQVLPVAKDIFVKNVLKQNGTSTEGTLPIQNEKKAADDSIVKANISPISLADAPDSSDQLQQLQMLMGLSLADELEEKTSRLLEQDNMRGTRSSSPSWMIERDEYNS
eukprot:28412-Hanusia_phi.AAC.1